MTGFVEAEETWSQLEKIDVHAKQGNDDNSCVQWLNFPLSDCTTRFNIFPSGDISFAISCEVVDNVSDPISDFEQAQFDFFVNGMTSENEILFQVWADSEINRDQIVIDKINFASAALNCIIAIASLLILVIVICCRRCESFAVTNLLLTFLVSSSGATV